MKSIHLLVMNLVFAGGLFQAQAQTLPAAPPAPLPQTAFGALAGNWERLDGVYMIRIKSVDADGKLDASYANPKPLPFDSATAKEEGGALKLLFELRAGGYNGSTYTLTYDAAGDRLKGVYYQAIAKQSFDVVFVRK